VLLIGKASTFKGRSEAILFFSKHLFVDCSYAEQLMIRQKRLPLAKVICVERLAAQFHFNIDKSETIVKAVKNLHIDD
jgi:hypothetical protein